MYLLGYRLPAQAGLTVGRMWYVYILKSNLKDWYYIGSTNNLNRRLLEHNSYKVRSTKAYSPFKIVWTKKIHNESDCRNYEKMLKSKRTEKESIIRSLNKI